MPASPSAFGTLPAHRRRHEHMILGSFLAYAHKFPRGENTRELDKVHVFSIAEVPQNGF